MASGREGYSTKDMLKALKQEALKEYREYDGNQRPSVIYQANTDAKDGNECLKTEFQYDGVSNRIVKKKETITDWQASWDM